MATVKIDLPDDQAAALKAKAAAQGLSLEDWFRLLANQEVQPRKSRYALTELMGQCDPEAQLSEEDQEWMESPAVGREAL